MFKLWKVSVLILAFTVVLVYSYPAEEIPPKPDEVDEVHEEKQGLRKIESTPSEEESDDLAASTGEIVANRAEDEDKNENLKGAESGWGWGGYYYPRYNPWGWGGWSGGWGGGRSLGWGYGGWGGWRGYYKPYYYWG